MKISFRTAIVIAIAVGVIGSILVPSVSKAQDIISQTASTMTAFQPAMNSNTSSSSNTMSSGPSKTPTTLYRERVPGKPEEGFVPVTPTAKKTYYWYTAVKYPYGEVLIFEDFKRNVVCYDTIFGGKPVRDCVPMK